MVLERQSTWKERVVEHGSEDEMNILEEHRVDTERAMEGGTEYEQPELVETKLRIAMKSDKDIEYVSGYWAQDYPTVGRMMRKPAVTRPTIIKK